MSTKKNLKPRKFYGLSGKSLTVESLKCHIDDDDVTETEDAAEITTEESN